MRNRPSVGRSTGRERSRPIHDNREIEPEHDEDGGDLEPDANDEPNGDDEPWL